MGTQLGNEGASVTRQDISHVRIWQEISKLQRSKAWEIQASCDPISDDVIYVNDVILS